ncbi:M15 family metallopeptidase [Limibaculum sp. FT325]|uniref:M15 family metallopeptidase n=1 Tax=Thermohalobaculum sediminis TaxID=2939436 RepID=UPI0020C05A8F|nr:M15 family metallopeptidase [Limibaculum sediminis]MCL5777325.1 M15 family metallopeptidase [Limibaculum sediminis]
MRYLPSILIALAILLAPLVWHLSGALFGEPAAEPEIVRLRAEIDEMKGDLKRLAERVDGLDSRTARALDPVDQGLAAAPNAEVSDSLRDAFAQVVLIANRRNSNDGLTPATPAFLEEMFGKPRDDLGDDCQPATNPKLTALLALEDVGPIKAHLIQPALISLRQIFANVQFYEPELYARIKSAGSLCVRTIRGAAEAASAHAYGLAVDINIDGYLDTLGDGKTQLGLTLLADFFKKEGWIWGAAFGREDSMHFEVSREKLEQWSRLGLI